VSPKEFIVRLFLGVLSYEIMEGTKYIDMRRMILAYENTGENMEHAD
jgi:hypothetical protein